MAEQSDYAINYVVLTQEILMDPNTNAIEKIVLARICGFDEFFESSETTAKLLHTTELVVQRAKRKLEKLGYIEVKTDTGRGKIYQPAHNNLWKSSSRYDKKVTSGSTKKSDQHRQKSQTYNKDKLNKEINGDESPAKAVENSIKEQTEYGDAAINAFMRKWHEVTGNDLSKNKRERRAAHNLIKSQSKEGITALLAAVQQIHESGDQYAPTITQPSDLVGQYSKLPKLRLYVAKHTEKPKAKKGRLVLDYDGLPPAYEISEADREAVKQKFKEMRKNGEMPFKINKPTKQEEEKDEE